jgi:mono/diheme cytochrome c family protein
MKQFFVQGLFAFFVAIALISCKHHPITDPVPPTGDTSTNPGGSNKVCFSRDILPLLQSNCATSGCHDASTQQDDVFLGDYNGIRDQVRPGNPGDSDLFEMITEDDEDERMPPAPRPRLSQAQIDLIRKWIEEGAENSTCTSTACDTLNVTFTKNINPILQQQCLSCHSNAGTGGGVLLNTYDNVKAVAGDKSRGPEGRLYGALSHMPAYSPMPKGGTKLDDCKLRQVKLWIEAGMPQ